MRESPVVNVSNGLGLTGLIVLFWNFDSYDYDLYDAILRCLTH